MFYLMKISVLFICVYVVKTTHSCVCTQPLNPQFLCVDQDCEDSLTHHYCNSNYVIKVLVISDRIFSAVPGSFSTKVGYKFKLVHIYKMEQDHKSALDSNIVWTSQDSCAVNLKRGRLYIITGSIDNEGNNIRTTSCDFSKAVKELKVNDIAFFGHHYKLLNCSQIDMVENTDSRSIENKKPVQSSTEQPIELDKKETEKKPPVKKPDEPQISSRPVIPDKNCYCGPTAPSMLSRVPGLNSINIGLGAANNNGENGWHNINGGLNIAIASGNGNSGQGIGSVKPSGTQCVLGNEGDGNGNGGINIGIASGNNNGGHGFNVGNGGNNVDANSPNSYGGVGGHNVGGNSGNGNGGQNIGIISGNGNALNGWNVGNGGNNADDNTFNSEVYVDPVKGHAGRGKGDSHNLGHGGNNVGDDSGNGDGGGNWGLWSGNDNGIHGWHTGNGGNNAGDNVGNGVVVVDDGAKEAEFVAHHSGLGGNNRGNNTGNGKGGSLTGYWSGQNNGVSSWNSGNGGNNVGNHSGNGMIGNGPPPVPQKRPGRRPVWTSGVGNGGNNIGSDSGNGLGSDGEDVKEVVSGFIVGMEGKLKPKDLPEESDLVDNLDKTLDENDSLGKMLVDDSESEIKLGGLKEVINKEN